MQRVLVSKLWGAMIPSIDTDAWYQMRKKAVQLIDYIPIIGANVQLLISNEAACNMYQWWE